MPTKYCTAAGVAAATLFLCLSAPGDAHAGDGRTAETCLAQAIYFEARGESPRGQMLVGQVILNRVESPRFPDTVCGVVYQNASHRDACQFSFACDGRPETVGDRHAWKEAVERSRRLLDCDEACRAGKGWTDNLWSATYYHAQSVSPRWASRLQRAGKVGAHLFYVDGVS